MVTAVSEEAAPQVWMSLPVTLLKQKELEVQPIIRHAHTHSQEVQPIIRLTQYLSPLFFSLIFFNLHTVKFTLLSVQFYDF